MLEIVPFKQCKEEKETIKRFILFGPTSNDFISTNHAGKVQKQSFRNVD